MDTFVINGMKSWMKDILKMHPSSFKLISFQKHQGPLEVIMNNSEIFSGAPKNIQQYWGYVEPFSPEIFLLMGWGFTYSVSKNALTAYHNKQGSMPTLDKLKENPYLLVGYGRVSFQKIDHIALDDMDIPQDSPLRILDFCVFVLSQAASSGHLFLKIDNVLSKIRDKLNLGLSASQFSSLLKMKENEDQIVLDRSVVYSSWSHFVEDRSASLLSKFVYEHKFGQIEQKLIDDYIKRYQVSNDIQFSELQLEALQKAVVNNTFILTGLPGTGKTTLTKCLCGIFQNLHGDEKPLLMTPTGVSAKKLQEVTGIGAHTIHKTFGYKGQSWDYNQARKYSVRAAIIDETSMVDQNVFYHLVAALKPETRLVLIGDVAQLPSVGPGNVLREMIQSKIIPTVALTEIFRQEEASDIILNAHRINKGQSIVLSDKKNPDFFYFNNTDQDKINKFITDVACKLHAKRDSEDYQVLSPMYRGEVGVDNLNICLRGRLNPPDEKKKEISLGGFKFREGDRVIVTKNMYKLGLYNGEIGKIHSVDYRKKELELKVYKPIRYVKLKTSDDRLHQLGLKLAYTITVHKVQGQEFDSIILPMVMSFFPLLQRNLLYTGITRAKKRMILAGDPKAISKAINNNKPILRNSYFGQRLIEYLEGRNVLA